jgi:hypothetical protein
VVLYVIKKAQQQSSLLLLLLLSSAASSVISTMADGSISSDGKSSASSIPEAIKTLNLSSTYKRASRLPTKKAKNDKQGLMEMKMSADDVAAKKRKEAEARISQKMGDEAAMHLAAAANPAPEEVMPKGKRGRPKGSGNKKGTAAINKPPADAETTKPGSNYTAVEDLCLCKAYVNCTLNPTKGTDQKAEHFWGVDHCCWL